MKARQAQLDAKRAEILAAAAAVFAEEGYDATSMDRVAERAGASKRTVYNHFGSKEALLLSVVEELLEGHLASRNVSFDPERPLEDQLREFARSKGALTEDETSTALLRVVLGIAMRYPELVERFHERYAAHDDSLEGWLRDADAAGALKVPDPVLAAELFWAMASGALFWPATIALCTPTSRERITDELVATFLARYRAP